VEQDTEVMNKDFACLTGKNKEKVLDMTKFLVLTQNTIVPAILQERQPEKRKATRSARHKNLF